MLALGLLAWLAVLLIEAALHDRRKAALDREAVDRAKAGGDPWRGDD